MRLENLLVVARVDEPASKDSPATAATAQQGFLRFERLTHIPFDVKCVEVGLMRPDELDWLDAYHADVWRKAPSQS